jgi:potassium efflux system protein
LTDRRAPSAFALIRNLVLAVSLAMVPAAAVAQIDEPVVAPLVDEGPDYALWEQLANRVEAALEDRRVSDAMLMEYRAQIVAKRARFAEAQTANRDRITTLREQLAALGDPPAEGETELPEIAERRLDLTERLARRQAPLLAADEAFRRADGLTREIDRVLRERQADALLTLWPSPLNPANWLQAINVVISSGLTVTGEVYNAWLDPARRAELRSNAPLTFGALLLAGLLLVMGRRWMVGLTVWALDSSVILRGRRLAAFFVSLSQFVVPVLGLLLLYTAILLTSLYGPTIEGMAEGLVAGGILLFIARWLSLLLFPFSDSAVQTALQLDDGARRGARAMVLWLAMVVLIWSVAEPFLSPETQSDSANAVLQFPLIVFLAMGIYRLARILRQHAPLRERGTEDAAALTFFDRMLLLITRGMLVVALITPLMAAVGYVNAARQIIEPTVESLALMALLIVLHGLVSAIYDAIVGQESANEALVPALAGLILGLVSVPVFALIWGVRDTDLLEILARFREGFALGETRISPANFLWFLVIFLIGYTITRAMQGALASSVLPRTRIERGAQKALVSGLGYVGLTIAALFAFSTAGIDLSGLAIVAGALSVGIGFGLQNIVSNFVSGIILLIERPVSEGDWVEVGGVNGHVRSISVRSTVIETFDRTEVIVPNSNLISGVVTNMTRTSLLGRVVVPVGVAYGTDTRHVEHVLLELARAQPLVTIDPAPQVVIVRFGADAIEFEIRAVVRDVNMRSRVQSDILHAVAARFRAEGIEIPFAQRDVWLRTPAVAGPVAAAAGSGWPPAPGPERLERDIFDVEDRPEPQDTPDERPPAQEQGE